jgi:hypothetical protein
VGCSSAPIPLPSRRRFLRVPRPCAPGADRGPARARGRRPGRCPSGEDW